MKKYKEEEKGTKPQGSVQLTTGNCQAWAHIWFVPVIAWGGEPNGSLYALLCVWWISQRIQIAPSVAPLMDTMKLESYSSIAVPS